MKKYSLSMILLVGFLLAACGDEHDHSGEDESPVEEGCEHMADGPAQSVTATAEAMGAPAGTFEHTRVDVTLVDDPMGMKIGYVSFEAAETAEYLVFTDNSVPLSILDASGTEVPIENVNTDVAACDAVAVEHLVDLEVGTYTFVWGPTDETEVSYVVEEAGGLSEDEE